MFCPDSSFRPRLQVASEDQIDHLHEATLEVLERTGIQVTHPRALELFDGAGAQVDGDRVRIPAWLVEDAIQTAPSRVVLGDRSGRRSVFLEGTKVWFGPSVDCIDYLDPLTDERRRFVSDDCAITSTVADALPNYTWVMTIGMADDVPPDIADRVIAKQVFSHTVKPLVFCCKDVDSVRDIYEMAVLIAGGEEAFRRAPTCVHYSEPISPLLYYDPAVEKIITCAEKGIPLINFPAPQAGSTAPATFAGEVVQGSAESLSGLVLAQLVRPGAPFIYGAFTTIMDMATTAFSYGAPEMNLMAYHMAELARGYGLPFFGMSGCSDAETPDAQAAAEATFSCLNAALSGADMVHDNGWLDSATLVSPEYMVLVDEIIAMVQQYMKGVGLEEEQMALDVIDRVGPGGHFLMEEHTMRHFRDIWYPQLFDRSPGNTAGRRDISSRIRERTRSLLATDPHPLPRNLQKELEELASRW